MSTADSYTEGACDEAHVPLVNVRPCNESSEKVASKVSSILDGPSQLIEVIYDNKIYTCKSCNESGSGTKFQEHLMKHLLQQPYKCLHCYRCFSDRNEIGGHMQKKHPGKEKKSALRANKRATVILSEAKQNGSFCFKSQFVYVSSKKNLQNGSVPSPAVVSSSNDTIKLNSFKVRTLSELPLSESKQNTMAKPSTTQSESHVDVMTTRDTLPSQNTQPTETSDVAEKSESVSLVEFHKNVPNTKPQHSGLHIEDKSKTLNHSEAISSLNTEDNILQSCTESEKDKDVLSLNADKDSQSLKITMNKDFYETTSITSEKFLEQSTIVCDLHNDHTCDSSLTQSLEQFSYERAHNQKKNNMEQTIDVSNCGQPTASKSGDVDQRKSTTVIEKDYKMDKNKDTANLLECESNVPLTQDNVDSKEVVTNESEQDSISDKVAICQNNVIVKSNGIHEEQKDELLVTKSHCSSKISREFKEKISQDMKSINASAAVDDALCKLHPLESSFAKSQETSPSNQMETNVSFVESKLTENFIESQTATSSTNNKNITDDLQQTVKTTLKSAKNSTSEKNQNVESPKQNSVTKPLHYMFSTSKVGSLGVSTIQHETIASASQQIIKFVQPNIIPPLVLANNTSPVCVVNTATSLSPVKLINVPAPMRYFIVPISVPHTMALAPSANIQQQAFPVTTQGNVSIPVVLPQTKISPNVKSPTTNYTQRITIKHKILPKLGDTNTGSNIPQSNVLSPVKIIPLSSLQYPLDSFNKHALQMDKSSPLRFSGLTKTNELSQTKEHALQMDKSSPLRFSGLTKTNELSQTKEQPESDNSFVPEDLEKTVDGITFKETSGDEKKRSNIFIAIVGQEYFCGKCRRRWKKKESFWFHLWNHQHLGGIFCDKCVRTNGPAGELTCTWTDSFIEELERTCRKGKNNPKNIPYNIVKARVTSVVQSQKWKPSELENTSFLPVDESKTSCQDDEKDCSKGQDIADDGQTEMTLKILECKSLDIKEFDRIDSVEECSSQSFSLPQSILELQSNKVEPEKDINQDSVLLANTCIVPMFKDLSDSDNAKHKSEMSRKNNDSIDDLIYEVQNQNLPSKAIYSNEDKEIENYLVHVQNKESSSVDVVEKTSNDVDKHKDSYTVEDYSSDIFSHIQAPAYHFYVCGGMCSFSCLLPGDFKQHLLACKFIQDGSFTCFHCGFVGESVEVLMKHMHKHAACHKNAATKPASAIFLCSIENCKFSTNILNAFYGHCCQAHLNLPSYTCANCEQVYPTAQDLAHHLKENLLSVVNCRHCMAKDIDKQIVMEHILFEHPGKGKILNTVKQLLCKERQLYGYNVCQSQFNMIDAATSVSTMNREATTASVDLSVHKSICGSTVQNKAQKLKIKEGKQSQHGSSDDSFYCHICSNIANDSIKLNDHLECHTCLKSTDDRLCFEVIKCTCCNFKTTRISCLDEHMKGHTIITSKAPAERVAAHSTTDVDTVSESAITDKSHLPKHKTGSRKKSVRSRSKDESIPVQKTVAKRRFSSDTGASKTPKSSGDEVIFTVPSNSVFQTDIACPQCSFRDFFKTNLLKHIKENHPMVVVKESSQPEYSVLAKQISLSKSKTPKENLDFVKDSNPDKLEDMKIGSCALHAELASFYKTSENVLVCSICEKVCSTKKLLHHHILDHLKMSLWKCTSCDFQDNRRFIIISHARNVHGTDGGVKPAKDFLKKLSAHKQHKKNPQKCDTQIMDSPLLNDEMNEKLKVLYKNEDYCFECTVCKVKYNTIISIHKHLLRTHLKIALFGCCLCSFEGLEENEVLEHMCDKHSGKPGNPLHLNVDVDASVKSFIDNSPKSLFIKKKKLMLGNDEMDSFLNCLYEVNRRMKLVCLICKDELSTKYSAHRHLLAHLDVNLVGCSSCEFKALSDRDVIEHMKLSHAGIQLKIDHLDVDIAEAVKDFFDRSCKTTRMEIKSKEGLQKRQTVEKSKATSSTSQDEKPLKVSSSSDMGCKKDVRRKKIGGLTKYKCRFCEYLALSVSSVCAHISKCHSKKEENLFKCSKCPFKVESLVEISNHMFEKHPWVLGDGFEAVTSNTPAISQVDTADIDNTSSKANVSKMLPKDSPSLRSVQETGSVSSTKESLSDASTSDNYETSETHIVPTNDTICSSVEKGAHQSKFEADSCVDVQEKHTRPNTSDVPAHKSREQGEHKKEPSMCSMDKEVACSLQLRVSSSQDIDTINKDDFNKEHLIGVYSNISADESTDSTKAVNEKTIKCGLVHEDLDKSKIAYTIGDPCMYDDISDDEPLDIMKCKKRKIISVDVRSKAKSDKIQKRKKVIHMEDCDSIQAESNFVEKQKQTVSYSKIEEVCIENPGSLKAVFGVTTSIKQESNTVFQCSKCLFITKKDEKLFASHLKKNHGILKYVQCGYCPAKYEDTKAVERHMHFLHKDKCNNYKVLPSSLLFKEVKHEGNNMSVDGTSGDQNESISSQSTLPKMVSLDIESMEVTKPKENTSSLIKTLTDNSSSKGKEENDKAKKTISLQKIFDKTKKIHSVELNISTVNSSISKTLGADSSAKTNDTSSKVTLSLKKTTKNALIQKKDVQELKQEVKKCKKTTSVKEKFSLHQDGHASKDGKKVKKLNSPVKETFSSSQDSHVSKQNCKKGKKMTISIKGKFPSSNKNEGVEKDKKSKTSDEVCSKYRCKYCSFEDSDTAKTRQHLYEHWHYKPYKCSFCLQGFTCSEKRALHAKEAHENIITFCRLKRNEETEMCANKMLKVFEQLAKPKLAKDKKQKNIVKCIEEYAKNEKLSKGKQKLTDNKCIEQLSKKSKTELKFGDDANFKCYHCDKSAFNLVSLRIHFGKKHGDLKKKCRLWIDVKTGQLCNMSGAIFEDKDKMVNYSQSFLCGYCSMRSSKRRSVVQHQHFCHNTKLGFIVNLNSAQIFGAHDNSDSTPSSPSTSDQCAEPVAKKLKLTPTQSPKKSEVAESNTKSICLSPARRNAIQYCCNQCSYKEVSLYKYRRHLASHGTFRYLCSDMSQACALKCGCCGYVASDASDFSSHVSSHLTGERTYKCGYCSYDSFKRCGVLSHLESSHSSRKVKILDRRKAQAAAIASSTKKLVNVEPFVRIKDIMGVHAEEFGDILLQHEVTTVDLSYIADDKILQILKLFGSAIPDDQLYELLNE